MNAPTTNLVVWYFTAALVNFIGALTLEGISIALGLEQQGLFQLWLYFFTALFAFLVFFYLGAGVKSSRVDQTIFGVLILMLGLVFSGADGLLLPFGLISCAISSWLLYRSGDLVFQVGLAGIAALGIYLVISSLTGGGAKIVAGHVLLDGASMLLWMSVYSWYLADSGRVGMEQVRRFLRQITGLALAGGVIWWFCPRMAPLIKVALVTPLLVLWGSCYQHRVDRFWEVVLLSLVCSGLLTSPSTPFYWRTLVWPLFIVALILIPRRYRRRLLNMAPIAGDSPSELVLKIGITLFLGGLWARVTGIALLGNAVLIWGYLLFLYRLFSVKNRNLPPPENTGEGHIVQGF